MTLNDLLIHVFTRDYLGYQQVSLHGDETKEEYVFYDFKATDTTYELPAGCEASILRGLKFAGIPLSKNHYRNTAPKTPMAILNNTIYSMTNGINYLYAEDGETLLFTSVFGYLAAGDGTPIMELTKEVEIAAPHKVTAYLLRVNRNYLNIGSKFADYLKGSIIKAALGLSIDNIPVSVIVDTIMTSPLRQVAFPKMDNAEHDAEVRAVLEGQEDNIISDTFPR